MFLPFNILFQLFVWTTSPGAGEHSDQKENKNKSTSTHCSYQCLVRKSFSNINSDGVYLQTMRVLQVELIVAGVSLVCALDSQR